jgi:transposase-like protein
LTGTEVRRESGFDDLVKEIVRRAEVLSAGLRRCALDVFESSRWVPDVAASLGIAQSCLYRWK